MKTSEVIRERIDTRLFDLNEDGKAGQDTFLCILFGDTIDVLVEIDMAIEELGRVGRNKVITSGRNWQLSVDGTYEERYVQKQCFRFLYMDFLAYYFESLGD